MFYNHYKKRDFLYKKNISKGKTHFEQIRLDTHASFIKGRKICEWDLYSIVSRLKTNSKHEREKFLFIYYYFFFLMKVVQIVV